MKSIEASVSEVLTREKKEAEVEKIAEEGKKYIRKENEVIFCLASACRMPSERSFVFSSSDKNEKKKVREAGS